MEQRGNAHGEILQLSALGWVIMTTTTKIMKITLTSLVTAALLGIAFLASGRPFDVADFSAILFTTGLVAWTFAQYRRVPRALMQTRPIRLPIAQKMQPSVFSGRRLAA
jgi:hypothetical protein